MTDRACEAKKCAHDIENRWQGESGIVSVPKDVCGHCPFCFKEEDGKQPESVQEMVKSIIEKNCVPLVGNNLFNAIVRLIEEERKRNFFPAMERRIELQQQEIERLEKEIAGSKAIMNSALDNDKQKDESLTLIQMTSKMANAIHWRTAEIRRLEKELAEAKELNPDEEATLRKLTNKVTSLESRLSEAVLALKEIRMDNIHIMSAIDDKQECVRQCGEQSRCLYEFVEECLRKIEEIK